MTEQNELTIGKQYKMRFMVGETLLTYSGTVDEITYNFVMFTDKKGDSIGYKRDFLVSWTATTDMDKRD